MVETSTHNDISDKAVIPLIPSLFDSFNET